MSYEEIKYSDGSTRRQWTNGNREYHRESGPALAYYNPDGSIMTEYFYLNGVQHREDGPAYISYNYDGSIESEYFYFNGNYMDSGERGFWNLWHRLNEEKRGNLSILKIMIRYL
jgi:antitoxin component YwqK of YwqJK toxin-antitoxin module